MSHGPCAHAPVTPPNITTAAIATAIVILFDLIPNFSILVHPFVFVYD
jgi:hypothetical protein